MKGTMKIKFEEKLMSEVTDYFAKDFTSDDGEIVKSEAFVDMAKGVVLFKLTVEDNKETAD